MKSIACYRLPYSDYYTTIESDAEPVVVSSLDSIGEVSGYVVAPFSPSVDQPIVVIRPDRVDRCRVKSHERQSQALAHLENTTPSASYSQAFKAFHGAVSEGRFRKLVLARSYEIATERKTEAELMSVFHQLCSDYPRLMVQLISTPVTGTWIIATPEILINKEGDYWRTMALAGTMKHVDDRLPAWSEKNIGEQHVVEQYIEDVLHTVAVDIIKDGPQTSRAGNLLHLRTDFRFHIAEGRTLGDLLAALHPTPAVCGLPKDKAREFIIASENMDRSYYSGFAGPVGINGETHLYVSLRCMKVEDACFRLYAGGGIMPGSSCESEWHETEEKMKTILNDV